MDNTEIAYFLFAFAIFMLGSWVWSWVTDYSYDEFSLGFSSGDERQKKKLFEGHQAYKLTMAGILAFFGFWLFMGGEI